MRGATLHAANTLGWNGGIQVRPGLRLISAGVAALAIGFALGLRAVSPSVSVSETIEPKNFDAYFEPYFDSRAFGSRVPNSPEVRVASLETEAAFYSATEDGDRQPESATSTRGRASVTEESLQSISHVASFDQRFMGSVDWPIGRRAAGAAESANNMLPPSPDLGGQAAARHAIGQSVRGLTPLPALPPAGVPKKQVRIAEAVEDLGPPPDADAHTAIYDISAHKVYLPNGQTLEAHSGFGGHLDDPHYVSEKDRGPTPPNVYDLSLREESFHGVRAIRLVPVGGGNMFGRDGLLAHSYMLGPNGQSNGCVSFSDYPTFLNAYLGGEINRLVVVEHLATTPSPKTALGGIAETIKALFGRS